MLLSHRGGAPHDVPADIWSEMWKPGVSMDQRRVAVQGMLGRPPEVTPGTKYVYANAGYMMVGAVLERATGVAWESMMQKRLFDPLGMAACAFGAPATKGMVDQPWGHTVSGTVVTPVPPQPAGDNPPSMGPAGTVNCSLLDWGKFLQLHLKGARGVSTLVSLDDITKMHTPWPGGDYALGWIVTDQSWAGGKVLTHDGSNTMFYATVSIAPAKNRIFVVASNRADAIAQAAIYEAFASLRAKYGG
jgi:CubicO group peptidase (beta-lactamase class C family)